MKNKRDQIWNQLELEDQELHFHCQRKKHKKNRTDLQIGLIMAEISKQLSQYKLSLEKDMNERLCELLKQCERVQKLERSPAELKRSRIDVILVVSVKLSLST